MKGTPYIVGLSKAIYTAYATAMATAEKPLPEYDALDIGEKGIWSNIAVAANEIARSRSDVNKELLTEKASALCAEIEKLPASGQQTDVSLIASQLRGDIVAYVL